MIFYARSNQSVAIPGNMCYLLYWAQYVYARLLSTVGRKIARDCKKIQIATLSLEKYKLSAFGQKKNGHNRNNCVQIFYLFQSGRRGRLTPVLPQHRTCRLRHTAFRLVLTLMLSLYIA